MEISTSSGYSTLFMAMALKKNSGGLIHTYELDPKAANSAAANFRNFQVDAYINLHVGDAKITSAAAPDDFDIYFLDSLHTDTFARWFIESHVLRASRGDALFHMHDIMPRHARVRLHDGPPFEGTPLDPHPKISVSRKIKDAVKQIFDNRPPMEDDRAPLALYPPAAQNALPTFDGNTTTEAALGNDLAAGMKQEDSVFLYDVIGDYPQLEPAKYHSLFCRYFNRSDDQNRPMEWNNSWWCTVSALKEAYQKMFNR